jgi:hypothetical protein
MVCDTRRIAMKKISWMLLTLLISGCGGGGGSSCSDDKPLECERAGTCCARGYPYSCGDGFCYQFGCPAGSPATEICSLKVAEKSQSLDVSEEVPVLNNELQTVRTSEGYPGDNES